MRRSIVLAAALAFDLAFGEPPAAIHPVVWFGKLAGLLERRARRGSPQVEFAGGAALTLLSLTAAWGAARVAEGAVARATRWLRGADAAWECRRGGSPGPPSSGGGMRAIVAPGQGRTLRSRAAPTQVGRAGRPSYGRVATAAAILAEAWLLKTTLSLRALVEAAAAVQQALACGDLAAARAGLRSLVSRDTTTLDASLIAAATIESVAENASDSLVAPALAYLAFGLPGAAVYRGLNTLDAMIGYHGRYEWLGKPAARLDDLANLLPARLSAALLALAALPTGRGRAAVLTAWRDHRLTVSPNAGWPMAAMAGALGVALEKRGSYRLGKAGRSPVATDIGRAVALLRRVAVLLMALVALIDAAWGCRR